MSDPVLVSLISAGFSFATTVVSVINNFIARSNRMNSHAIKTSIENIEANTDDFKSTVAKLAGQKEYAEWLLAQQRVQEENARTDPT